MSILSFAILLGGKSLLRKALERTSYVEKQLGVSSNNQSLALYFSENEKSLSQIASFDAPFRLIVTLRKEVVKTHIRVL